MHDVSQLRNMLLTESQAMLRDAIERYVRDHPEQLIHSGAARPNGAWSDFADRLGILALAFGEDSGGLACGAIETMLVVEQLGSALAAEPYLSSAVVAPALLNGLDGVNAAELAGGIATGKVIAAAAIGDEVDVAATRTGQGYTLSGRAGFVVSAGIADVILLRALEKETGEVLLFAISPAQDGIRRHDYVLLDRNKAGDFTFDGAAVSSASLIADQAGPRIARARDIAGAAYCAELVGIMERMLRDTVTYTTQRVQFGQPLSRFQVLQHRMADMFVEVELSRSMALMAALAVEGPATERAKAVSAALARTLKGARLVANEAVQLHGGIGTTDELELGRYFKRVRTLASLLGPADSHITAFANAGQAAKE